MSPARRTAAPRPAAPRGAPSNPNTTARGASTRRPGATATGGGGDGGGTGTDSGVGRGGGRPTKSAAARRSGGTGGTAGAPRPGPNGGRSTSTATGTSTGTSTGTGSGTGTGTSSGTGTNTGTGTGTGRSKAQRQLRITRLLGEHQVTSQPQLLELLAEIGVAATQATVSRDLDDLGAVRIRLPGGELAYAIPAYEPQRLAPHDHLRRVLGEWVAEVTHAGHLVVVRTPPGCAHVVASALDRSGLPGLIGTVAGDDTLLCVASEPVGGPALATTLRDFAGLGR